MLRNEFAVALSLEGALRRSSARRGRALTRSTSSVAAAPVDDGVLAGITRNLPDDGAHHPEEFAGEEHQKSITEA